MFLEADLAIHVPLRAEFRGILTASRGEAMATKPAQKIEVAYDPAVALDFFKSAGKPETIAEGKAIFAESERAIPLLRKSKMYLLLKGEVELRAKKKPIGPVRPGEIFGEIAVMAHAPRTACLLYTSDAAD